MREGGEVREVRDGGKGGREGVEGGRGRGRGHGELYLETIHYIPKLPVTAVVSPVVKWPVVAAAVK